VRRSALRAVGWVAALATTAVIAGCSVNQADRLPAAAARAHQGDPTRGQQLISTYGCGSCHVVPGVRQANGLVGPPLTSFGKRSYIAGELPNNAANLKKWIMNPTSVEPGTAMPDLGVTAVDAQDIAAYLLTLN
jgi:cytochrome c